MFFVRLCVSYVCFFEEASTRKFKVKQSRYVPFHIDVHKKMIKLFLSYCQYMELPFSVQLENNAKIHTADRQPSHKCDNLIVPLVSVVIIRSLTLQEDTVTSHNPVHRGSYMSAHVLLNLLNELGKRDKMRGLPSILSRFRKEFNKFNKTGARMLDSINHMALRLL